MMALHVRHEEWQIQQQLRETDGRHTLAFFRLMELGAQPQPQRPPMPEWMLKRQTTDDWFLDFQGLVHFDQVNQARVKLGELSPEAREAAFKRFMEVLNESDRARVLERIEDAQLRIERTVTATVKAFGFPAARDRHELDLQVDWYITKYLPYMRRQAESRRLMARAN